MCTIVRVAAVWRQSDIVECAGQWGGESRKRSNETTLDGDYSRLPSALGRPRLRVRGEARGRCVYETNLKEGMRLPREWLEAAGDGGREADEREPN
jgi:hypothetical protein